MIMTFALSIVGEVLNRNWGGVCGVDCSLEGRAVLLDWYALFGLGLELLVDVGKRFTSEMSKSELVSS